MFYIQSFNRCVGIFWKPYSRSNRARNLQIDDDTFYITGDPMKIDDGLQISFFIIVGGLKHNDTGTYTPEQGFVLGPSLPIEVSNHCIDKINSTHGIMVSGQT